MLANGQPETIGAANAQRDLATMRGQWRPIIPALSSSFPGGGVFTQSEADIPVIGGEMLLIDMVGGGQGGAGGGNNAISGGGGGSGEFLVNIMVTVPLDAATMDIAIGVGGGGGAVGSAGFNGTPSIITFRDAAGVALWPRVCADAQGTVPTAGGTLANCAGGNGGSGGAFTATGGTGVAGAAGGNSSALVVRQFGWGSVSAYAGGGGGGVNAGGTAGLNGGISGTTSSPFGTVGNSTGGTASGTLGGGGGGGRAAWPWGDEVILNGGNGGAQGSDPATAGPGGTIAYGCGGPGGGGNAAGRNGAQGAVRIMRQWNS